MDTLLDFLKDNQMIILGGALGGLLGLLVSYRHLGKIIRMIRTPTGEIANLPAGEQVEVVGKADGETGLQSPITKTPCVFWQVLVSEKRSSGKSSHWVIVHSSRSSKPFDVYDGTGRVRVHPGRGLELLLRDDAKKSSGIFSSLDEQTQSALSGMGVDTKGFLNMNRALRVQERYIEQGDQIYLLGKTFSNSGTRVMDSEDSSLVVSDQSEVRLLGKFGWQVIVNIMLFIVVGVAVAFYFSSR
jgi:hypothetical protein